MSELGRVPDGLMRLVGSDLYWGVALAELRVNPDDRDEWILVFPLLTGPLIIGSTTVPGLSGN